MQWLKKSMENCFRSSCSCTVHSLLSKGASLEKDNSAEWEGNRNCPIKSKYRGRKYFISSILVLAGLALSLYFAKNSAVISFKGRVARVFSSSGVIQQSVQTSSGLSGLYFAKTLYDLSMVSCNTGISYKRENHNLKVRKNLPYASASFDQRVCRSVTLVVRTEEY